MDPVLLWGGRGRVVMVGFGVGGVWGWGGQAWGSGSNLERVHSSFLGSLIEIVSSMFGNVASGKSLKAHISRLPRVRLEWWGGRAGLQNDYPSVSR